MTIITIIICVVLIVFVLRLTDKVDRLEILVKNLNSSAVPTSIPVAAAQPQSAYVPPAAVTPHVIPAVVVENKEKKEFKLGAGTFTAVGVLALLLGVGFFFRYAVQNGLLSEPARVAIGIVAGIIVGGIGLWLKNKYRVYGVSLIGTGLGIIYLSWYAAYALYALVPAGLGFALMAGTAAVGIILAIVLNARQLATAALLGGYVGVVLFTGSLTLTSAFAALFVLALIASVLTIRKEWPEVLVVALAATTLSLLGYLYAHEIVVQTALPLVTALYVLFVGSMAFGNPRQERPYIQIHRFSLYFTPIAYFLVSSSMLDTAHSVALVAFGLAIFYAAIGIVARMVGKEHSALSEFVMVTDLFIPGFLALGIGLYFKGNAPIMFIAIEAALAISIGLRYRSKFQYFVGQFLLVLSGLWALVFVMDSSLYTSVTNFSLVLDTRTLTLGVLALSYAAAWLMHKYLLVEEEKPNYQQGRVLDALMTYGALFLIANIESFRAVGEFNDHVLYAVAAVSIVSAVMVTIAVAVRESVIRQVTYALFAALSITLIFISITGEHPIFLVTFYVLDLAAILALGAVIHLLIRSGDVVSPQELKAASKLMTIFGNLSVLIVLTMEIATFFALHAGSLSHGYASRVSISLFWLVYALGAMSIGIMHNSKLVRQMGIGLLVVAGLKICIYDAQELSDLYRFASFFGLGIILLLAGFLYYRFREKMESLVGITQPEQQSKDSQTL
jgi:uncharacterized membrane protein